MSTALDYQGGRSPTGEHSVELNFPPLPHSIPHLQVGKPMLFFMEKIPEPALLLDEHPLKGGGQTLAALGFLRRLQRYPQPDSPGPPNTSNLPLSKTRAHHLPGLPETASVLAPTMSFSIQSPQPPSYCAQRKREGDGQRLVGTDTLKNWKKQESTWGKVLNSQLLFI